MTNYDEQFKLAVVQEYLSGSAGHKRVAQLRGIPRTRLLTWANLYQAHGADGLKTKRGRFKKMPELPVTKPESLPDAAGRTHEELGAEVNQVRMEVAYLKKLRALVQAQQQQRTTTPKKRK